MIGRLLTVAHCVAAAAEAFGVTATDVRSARTGAAIARARFAAIGLALELTEAGYAVIGRAIGSREHASIAHGQRRCQELSRSDSDFAARLEGARAALLILQRAGLAHLLDALDAVAIARRIAAHPGRYAAMATAHEITALAQWIVEMAGDADPLLPDPTASLLHTADPETPHAA